MGTSKRRLNAEIKNILKEKSLDKLNNSTAEITKIILTKDNLLHHFQNEEMLIKAIDITSYNLKNLDSLGFNGKSKKDVAEDELTQEKFMDLILNEIESENFIESKLLEKSLKIVMCKFFEDEFVIYSFAQLLFYQIVYELLFAELFDTLKDTFEQIPYNQIEEK